MRPIPTIAANISPDTTIKVAASSSEWRDVETSVVTPYQDGKVVLSKSLAEQVEDALEGAPTPIGTTFKAVKDSLKVAVYIMYFTIQFIIGKTTEIINSLLDATVNMLGNTQFMDEIEKIWTQVRNLGLGLLTLGLLIIAFANVLSIQTENYALQRMIPKIIISIIMAQFSFLIARFFLELAGALQATVFSIDGATAKTILPTIAKKPWWEKIGEFIDLIKKWDASIFDLLPYGAMLSLVGVILIIVLLYLLILILIRNYLLFFLIILAPLAFVMNIMPFTEFLYKKWWDEFFKWVFMGPAIMFFLWMGGRLIDAFDKVYGIGTTLKFGDPNGVTLLILLAIAIFAAAYVPHILGGKIASTISGSLKKAGKWAWKQTPVYTHGKEFLAQANAKRAEATKKRVRDFSRALAGTGRMGSSITGYKHDQKGIREEEIKNYKEGMKEQSIDSLVKTTEDQTQVGTKVAAAMRELVERGVKVNDDRIPEASRDSFNRNLARHLSDGMNFDNYRAKGGKDAMSAIAPYMEESHPLHNIVQAAAFNEAKNVSEHEYTENHAKIIQSNPQLLEHVAGRMSIEGVVKKVHESPGDDSKKALRKIMSSLRERAASDPTFAARVLPKLDQIYQQGGKHAEMLRDLDPLGPAPSAGGGIITPPSSNPPRDRTHYDI